MKGVNGDSTICVVDHELSRMGMSVHYGIPGCGVFMGGIQNLKGLWLKNNCIQMKLPNFEN